jgi:hypothetical protein
MDFQLIFNIVAVAIVGTIGWFARELWSAVQDLKNDLKFIQIDLPSNYVKKTDLDVQFNKIEISLQRILDKLDQKADK